MSVDILCVDVVFSLAEFAVRVFIPLKLPDVCRVVGASRRGHQQVQHATGRTMRLYMRHTLIYCFEELVCQQLFPTAAHPSTYIPDFTTETVQDAWGRKYSGLV